MPITRQLFATRDDLQQSAKQQVAMLLDRRLADAVALQEQCKQESWNVVDSSPEDLGRLIDNIHSDVGRFAVQIAERVERLGGVADEAATFQSRRSELEEHALDANTGEAQADGLSAALDAFGSRMVIAVHETEALGDSDSARLCAEILRGVDEWRWFVRTRARLEG